MALKYGFKAYLVDPAYTSVVGNRLSRELGLDKHSIRIHAHGKIPGTKPEIHRNIPNK
ncbi:MAG: hypothetical protein QXJ19_04525 [Candidatus Bathyarchaeia archaeon]